MNEQLMNPPAIHGEQIAGRSAHVRKQLLLLNSDIKHTEFDVADLLFEAQEGNYPLSWGFESTLDYAFRELGLKKRRAQYFTRVTKVCRAVGLTRAQYEPSGMSKLREITTLDPEGSFWNRDTKQNEPMDEHIVRLILDSDKMNTEQIKLEIARLKGQTGKDLRVIRSYSTDITTWTNVISQALELARKKLGSKGRDEEGNAKEYSEGECYEVICAAFNADPNNAEDPEDVEATQEKAVAPPTIPMETI